VNEVNGKENRESAPLRAAVIRGTIRESLYAACFAAADDSGNLLASAGDSEMATTLRSAAKPLQAVPLTTLPAAAELDLRDEELAICCASHPGLPRHAALAASTLALSGFAPDDLVCGPGGDPPVPIRHGCSGNHACLLLIARLLGAPLAGYERPDHPAQTLVRATIQDMANMPSLESALDGCGIPTFGLPLRNMATAYAALTRSGAPWSRIPRVMAAHPELIGAEDWIDVRLMQVTGGRLIAKTGAEGLLCVGIPDAGKGLAVKALDGSTRALGLFALEALRRAGWIREDELASPLLAPFLQPVVFASTGPAALIRLLP
jgi:L-asparaginase